MAELTKPDAGQWLQQGQSAQARSAGSPQPGKTQTVALATTAAFSTVLTANVHYLVTSDADCFIRESPDTAVGNAAVATADMYLPAKTPRLVFMGQDAANTKYIYLSAVTATGTGKLYITPMDGI